MWWDSGQAKRHIAPEMLGQSGLGCLAVEEESCKGSGLGSLKGYGLGFRAGVRLLASQPHEPTLSLPKPTDPRRTLFQNSLQAAKQVLIEIKSLLLAFAMQVSHTFQSLGPGCFVRWGRECMQLAFDMATPTAIQSKASSGAGF